MDHVLNSATLSWCSVGSTFSDRLRSRVARGTVARLGRPLFLPLHFPIEVGGALPNRRGPVVPINIVAAGAVDREFEIYFFGIFGFSRFSGFLGQIWAHGAPGVV